MVGEIGEGKQVQLLRVIMRKAVEDIVDQSSVSEALAGVPNIPKKRLDVLAALFEKTVRKKAEESIDLLIKDEGIDQLLKKREELIQTQKNMEGTIAWRPTGSVLDDMRSHNMKVLKVKRKQATVLCEKVEQEVETLTAEVLKVRSKAHQCQTQLNLYQDKLEKLMDAYQNLEDAHMRIAGSLFTS